MRFSHIIALTLAVLGVYGNPVTVMSLERDNVIGIPSGLLPAPDIGLSTLEKRQTFLQWKTTHGIFGAVVSLARRGMQVWIDLANTCEEWNGETKTSARITCVWNAASLIIMTALDGYAYATGAASIANTLAAAGVAKRDEQGRFVWSSHWDQLDANQQARARSQLPQPRGLYLHSIADGIPELTDSVAFHFATNSTGRMALRHITNGTHGLVHTLDHGANSTVSKRATADTYTWSNAVAGMKLSYQLPCDDEHIPMNEQNNIDILNTVLGWISWATFSDSNASDAYNIELVDTYSGKNIMLGTFIAEGAGFGNNYEGLSFTPTAQC